ncbi:MAG: PPOX class F420-dependent oxidoreductase, partial [Bacteroidota bacterium]
TFYVRTTAGSGKVKRINNNGDVQIAPCEANGNPIGEWVNAHAVEVTDPETADLVQRLLEKKYGIVQVKAFAAATALRREKYTVLKISLS